MNTTTSLRTLPVWCVLLAGALLAACQDGVGPAPLTSDPSLSADEAALDQAATSLESPARQMAAEAEGERGRAGDRRRDGRRHPDRVGLAVELGGTAVALATRILDAHGADEAQLRLLDSAAGFQRRAEAALAAGQLDRAVALAERACWTALKAVVLPGGVTDEEARFIHDLAADLLVEARAHVASGGSSVEAVLLRWAEHFFEVGSAQLERGHIRGVAALWKSAVVSAWIVG